MNNQAQIPSSPLDVQALLRQSGLPELNSSILREIVQKEGEHFLRSLAEFASNPVNAQRERAYISAIITAVVPATRNVLRQLGFVDAPTNELIDLSKAEGRTFAQAIRALNTDFSHTDNQPLKQYLTRILQPLAARDSVHGAVQDQTQSAQVHRLPSRQSDQPPATNAQPQQPTTARRGAATPSRNQKAEQPESANQYAGTSFHLYGGKAAFCFSLDTTRKPECPTVRIEAAKASGTRQYDWTNKATFQLTVSELPLVFGVFFGYLNRLELSGHGTENEKALTIEDQNDKFFLSLQVRGGGVFAMPAPPKDTYPIMSMLLKQIQANSPDLAPQQVQMLVQRVCTKHPSTTRPPRAVNA